MTTTSKAKIALIIGSTRAARFADKPAAWMLEQASAREEFDTELVDLRDFDLPFFDEMASNLYAPSQNENVLKWQAKMAEFDGYIFVVAEYNHSVTASLKNALDQAGVEWIRKPMGAIGYSGLGAARAIEHLRNIAVELQMVPVRTAVHIGGGEMGKVHPMGGNGPMSDIEEILKPSATGLLDELAWWTEATRVARAKDAA
ncbi:MAG: NADPH-dependent FMN reductase [Marinosulfonomonas sp.]